MLSRSLSKHSALSNVLLLLCASSTYAAGGDIAEDLQVHGFIAQGVIDVSGSDFVNDEQEISTELTEIGFNASYQLNNDFRLTGQVVYLEGGNRYSAGARLDYALLDWNFYDSESWSANLYLGRFKNNHWLYSSTRDIPFARPSIILPQAIYFDGLRDVAVGGDGYAIKISHSSDNYGDFDFNFSRGSSNISDKQKDIIAGPEPTGGLEHDLDLQASLYWRPNFSQWRFGMSLLDSDFHYLQGENDGFTNGDFTYQFYTVNALFEGEKLEFAMEILQQRLAIDNFYFTGFAMDNIGQGFYTQFRYKFTNNLVGLIRYDDFYSNKDDKKGHELEETTGLPNYFGYQTDRTIGLAYDIDTNLRVNVEYHWVNGTARLTPLVTPNPELNDSEDWQMWAVQLMYWF